MICREFILTTILTFCNRDVFEAFLLAVYEQKIISLLAGNFILTVVSQVNDGVYHLLLFGLPDFAPLAVESLLTPPVFLLVRCLLLEQGLRLRRGGGGGGASREERVGLDHHRRVFMEARDLKLLLLDSRWP